MGKASSAKKVARAAGLGGSRAYGSRPPWAYYFAILVLVVLGIVGIYNSREYQNAKIDSQGNVAPKVGVSPPWYEGFAVDACGKLLPPIKTNKDPYGITTSGNGVIEIAPTVKSAAGHNATLGKFASSIGMTLNAAEFQVPGGKLYLAGDKCEGKPGRVYVMTWSSPQAPQSDGVLQSKDKINLATGYEDTCSPDCDSGVLLENDQLMTLAFLPAPPKHKALVVLQPPQSVISEVTKLVASAATTTTTPAPPTTPVTAKTAKPTAKTAKPTAKTAKPSVGTTTTTTAANKTKTAGAKKK